MYLNVTDPMGRIVVSNIGRVVFISLSRGGYSILLARAPFTLPPVLYNAVVAALTQL